MNLRTYKVENQVLTSDICIKVPIKINDFKISEHAIRRLIIAVNAQKRQCPGFTKKRGAVSGGGRKPWRQKGTGNARQGSIRAPQWRGGGNVFGPTGNENFTQKINKKERRIAIKSAWWKKISANEVIIADKINVKKPRVAVLIKLLGKLYTGENILIVDESVQQDLFLASRNLINVKYYSIVNLSAKEILRKHLILLTAKAWELLIQRFV